MQWIDRYHTIFILGAVGLGLLLGQLAPVAVMSEPLITPFLVLMLYGLFLTTPLHDLRAAFQHRSFMLVAIVVNFVLTPLIAWGLGAAFLGDLPELWLGFILLMVTPCTDWVLAFTKVARGNLSIATAILPINLLLQVILLPVYMLLFAGTIGSIPIGTLLESVGIVLVLPFGAALLSKALWQKRDRFHTVLLPFFESAQFVLLLLAISAMFASFGSSIFAHRTLIIQLLIPIICLFAMNYFIAWVASKWFLFSYADRVSLTMTVIARNSPLALAVAVTAFPTEPLIALVLVIGPLIELPLLTIISRLLIGTEKKTSQKV